MFSVIESASALAQFKYLLALAEKTRSLRRFQRAARQMVTRLESNPERCGESREPEPVGGFIQRIAFFAPLCVRYAVHPGKKLVLITGLTPSNW